MSSVCCPNDKTLEMYLEVGWQEKEGDAAMVQIS